MNSWIRSLVMPVEGTAYAHQVDSLYLFLIYVCIFFFVLVTGLLAVFIIRYRRRSPGGSTPQITHNRGLEIAWTVVPLALVMLIFFWGLRTFMQAAVAPADAEEIHVTARQWMWQFEYPNGVRAINELHVPLDKPVKLIMTSEDVIHGFYVPTFRLKQDVLPDTYTQVWFTATDPGVHVLECTQYCGRSHSQMLGKIYVDDPASYRKWLATGGEAGKGVPPVQWGRTIYETRGCATCHSIDGTPGQGPSFKGIYGHTVSIAGGRTMVVDENYIHDCILTPDKNRVAGFPPIMPTFQGILNNRDIDGVIAFIKSLK
jgi:cytochrome c oxidase subunit 2